ncbi:MAG: hypothetical protein NTV30_06185 [Chloroflexi bacterium]|nr:hypothetical protein [Chloroflexota bacterium]
MKVDFAFICDYAEATGKINALGIGFDRIVAARLPIRIPHFSLVIQLRSSSIEAGEKSIKVHLIDDDGQPVINPLDGKFTVVLPQEGEIETKGRVVMEFGNVQFNKYGGYSIRAIVEGIELVDISFRVSEPPKAEKNIKTGFN